MQHNKIYTITPKSKFSLGLKELFEYRELIYIFTWREIKVKIQANVFGRIVGSSAAHHYDVDN